MEMIIVAGIVMVGSAMAIPMTTRMIRDAKGDSSAVMMATFVNSGRNRAVSERRNVQLTFLPPDRVRLERIEVPSGTLTIVGELQLEGNQELVKDPDMTDTPDTFGDATAFSFTGPTPVMFTSDGSLIDSAGDPTNGTIFIERPGFPETARAVTISGVTGMVRTWKWRGSQWMQ